MKKLFMVDNCYRPTSAGTNRMIAFAKNLGEREVYVTFFFLFPSVKKEKCMESFKNVEFVYLWEDSKSNSKYVTTLSSFLKLWRLLTPDVPVYVYSMINLLYFFRKKKGIRLYSEITECPEFSGRESGIMGRLLYRLFKKTVPKLDGLFVITPSLKDYFVVDYHISPDKVIVVNMTVDPDRFDSAHCDNPSNYISYCGIMGDRKDGISNLIRSFAVFQKNHNDYKLFLMGGYEDEESRKRLSSLVIDLNLERFVIFKGIVPQNEMPQRLVESKILVLDRPRPKEKAYGFATKIGEYLMSERPVVMTNVANVEDYLTNMHDVILAEPENVEDFADKLIWTADNYEKADEIGKQGKNTALKVFNACIEAEKIYHTIYS